ncbi:MAG: hypothetical protein WAU60_06245 [Candidatus Competibacter denitrificans]|jgi:hypothetical protein
MQRDRWTFRYAASELTNAAKAKRDHHEQRVLWWQAQKDGVMTEVRESGIEVSESLAIAYKTSADFGPQVMVRNDLQQKLTECHNKIKAHTAQAREYDGWVQVLESSPGDSEFSLAQDDWLYFFGDLKFKKAE